jgi:hypothetical protein
MGCGCASPPRMEAPAGAEPREPKAPDAASERDQQGRHEGCACSEGKGACGCGGSCGCSGKETAAPCCPPAHFSGPAPLIVLPGARARCRAKPASTPAVRRPPVIVPVDAVLRCELQPRGLRPASSYIDCLWYLLTVRSQTAARTLLEPPQGAWLPESTPSRVRFPELVPKSETRAQPVEVPEGARASCARAGTLAARFSRAPLCRDPKIELPGEGLPPEISPEMPQAGGGGGGDAGECYCLCECLVVGGRSVPPGLPEDPEPPPPPPSDPGDPRGPTTPGGGDPPPPPPTDPGDPGGPTTPGQAPPSTGTTTGTSEPSQARPVVVLLAPDDVPPEVNPLPPSVRPLPGDLDRRTVVAHWPQPSASGAAVTVPLHPAGGDVVAPAGREQPSAARVGHGTSTTGIQNSIERRPPAYRVPPDVAPTETGEASERDHGEAIALTPEGSTVQMPPRSTRAAGAK